MTELDKTKPVLVTGATGYVAGWIVKGLLDRGYDVHATVRDPDNSEKLKYLNAAAENAPGNISYFKADLLDQGAFSDAMAGCQLVFHTASPFVLSVSDAQKELIDPAILGTSNVLTEANNHDSVKRIVLTSSVVSIYGDAIEVHQTPEGMFNEDQWNTTSSLTHQPYSYSKVQAEKKAWELAEAANQWDLVVINPGFVLGPGLSPISNSESFKVIKQMGDGSSKPGLPDLHMATVDVRDLADAHIKAGLLPEAKGRHVITGQSASMLEMSQILSEKYGRNYSFGSKILPKWLLWLVGPMVNKAITRKFISLNVGHPLKFDNSKSINQLGMSYRPIKETLEHMFQQMIDFDFFKK